MMVKEKRRKLGISLFKIHGSIVMLTRTQNWDYLPIVSWDKPYMYLKPRKSRIEWFKWIEIRS